jgi:hypothetical protein
MSVFCSVKVKRTHKHKGIQETYKISLQKNKPGHHIYISLSIRMKTLTIQIGIPTSGKNHIHQSSDLEFSITKRKK